MEEQALLAVTNQSKWAQNKAGRPDCQPACLVSLTALFSARFLSFLSATSTCSSKWNVYWIIHIKQSSFLRYLCSPSWSSKQIFVSAIDSTNKAKQGRQYTPIISQFNTIYVAKNETKVSKTKGWSYCVFLLERKREWLGEIVLVCMCVCVREREI